MNNMPTIGSMIRFSLSKSREILFPFNLKRWFKFLIIVWLAGAGIQGFSANFKTPVKSPTTPPKVTVPQPPKALPSLGISQTSSPSAVAGETMTGAESKSEKKSSIGQSSSSVAKLRSAMERNKNKMNPLLAFVLLGVFILLGVGAALFFVWLSCRFNFVLLNALVTRDPSIREPFFQNKKSGNSYFAWLLIFFGVGLGSILILGGFGIGFWVLVKGNIVASVFLGILAGFLALAVFLGMISVGVVMRDMVLPIMYREKIPAMNALKKFLEGKTFAFGKLVQYLLVVFGLWILALIFQGIVGILAVLGGLMAGGIVAIPGVLLIKSLPFLKFPLIVLGILVALALILAVIVVIGMIMLPAVIFFRVFALAYLTRLYPDCDLLHFQG